MEQPFFLTDEEMITITDRTQWASQRKVLQANHIKFTVSATGKPLVIREHLLYGTKRPQKQPDAPTKTIWQPNIT